MQAKTKDKLYTGRLFLNRLHALFQTVYASNRLAIVLRGKLQEESEAH